MAFPKITWLGGRYGILFLAFVVSVAFIGVWSYQLWQGKERAIRSAEVAAANLARASEDANNRTIQAVDLILTSAAISLRPGGLMQRGKGNDFLFSLLDEAPQVREVAFADLLGKVTSISRRGPLPNLSVAREPYFQQARSGKLPSLFIGKLSPGRLLGDYGSREADASFWHIIAARAMYDDEGAFVGVVLAVLNPRFLQEQVNALDVGRRGYITYYHYDGELLVQSGNDTGSIARISHADTPLFTDYLSQREWGTFRQKADAIYSEASIVSYQTTTRWPIVVAVVLNIDEALADWLREANRFSAVMAGGLSVLLILAIIVYRQRTHVEESEKQLTLLGTALRTSANMALITDRDANIVWVNEAFCKQFGYEFDEIIGQNPSILKSGLIPPNMVADMWDVILRGQIWNGEMVNRRRDGSLVVVNQTISPILDENGEITHFVGIHDDITERKQSEKTLLEAKNEAEEANKAKSEFLASMSHELRTPLNAVLGFAQLLQYDPGNPLKPAQEVYVESILEGGNHLLQLVNEVLDLARIEASQIDVTLEVIDSYPIVSECVALTIPLGESQGIRIINEFSHGSAIAIRTDKVRFKQALLNLLSNAVKYNKPNGLVTVDGFETEEGFMRFLVKDTGVGIAEEDRDNVFQMFRRLDADPMITREGTGIGLTVTKTLMEHLGGRLGFESEKGSGSTFWIEIPLASNGNPEIWKDVVRTGIEPIDNDHNFLLSLLGKVAQPGLDDASLQKVADELMDYTDFHFRREEAIMEACECPRMKVHRKNHYSLRQKVNEEILSKVKSDDPDKQEQLFSFLQNWLFDHILKEDSEIAACAKNKEHLVKKALRGLPSPVEKI